jgi:hypothetical protein
MTHDTTIPPEAVEAAARAMCKRAYEHLPEMREQDTFTPDADYWMGQATAALRAGIAAWPGMLVEWHSRGPGIILPLPKENTNAEG